MSAFNSIVKLIFQLTVYWYILMTLIFIGYIKALFLGGGRRNRLFGVIFNILVTDTTFFLIAYCMCREFLENLDSIHTEEDGSNLDVELQQV